jgi:hypothetical protein
LKPFLKGRKEESTKQVSINLGDQERIRVKNLPWEEEVLERLWREKREEDDGEEERKKEIAFTNFWKEKNKRNNGIFFDPNPINILLHEMTIIPLLQAYLKRPRYFSRVTLTCHKIFTINPLSINYFLWHD